MPLPVFTLNHLRNFALGGVALLIVIWGLERFVSDHNPATANQSTTVSQENITRYVSERPITLPELLTDPELEKRFTALPTTTEPIGGNDFVHVWLRIPLRNTTTQPLHYVIEVKQHGTQIAQLYMPNAEGSYQLIEHTLQDDKIRTLLEPYSVPAFPIIIPPGSEPVFFLRLQNARWLDPSINIWSSPDDFIQQLRADDRLINTYIGLMAGLFIANLCVFVAFGYRDILYYLLYLISSFAINAMNFRLHTIAAEYLPFIIPDYDVLNLPPFFLGLLLLNAGLLLLFAGEFVDLRQLRPGWARFNHSLIIILLAGAPLMAFGPASAIVNTLRSPIILLWGFANLSVLMIGIYAAWHRQRHAPYLMPAIALLVVVSIYLAQLSLNGKPATDALLEHWLFASCAEMVILAFGLIGRFLQINQDRQNAQREVLREMEKSAILQQQFTQKLTAEVKDRTAELSASNQQKERLITVLAHDMRTPLNSLVSVSGLMARTPHQFSHEQLRHFASEIEGNARGVSSLMENLLCWAQLENGQIKPVFQEYLLSDVFDEAVSQINTQANLKSIAISRDAPRQLFIKCDFNSIVSVMRNLLSNAVKFVPDHGTISLAGQTKGNQVQIEVIDSGRGIPADEVAAINRREKVGSRFGINGERGTGLGLLICHDLLRMHESRLHVTSQPGKTRFVFSLPGHVFNTPMPFPR